MKQRKVSRYFRFLRSMTFGIFLLGVILIFCIIGTIIPQGKSLEEYALMYPDYLVQAIRYLHLDHLYTSLGFAICFAALGLNLILCSTLRLGEILNKLKDRRDIHTLQLLGSYRTEPPQGHKESLRQLFKSYGAGGLRSSKCINGVYFSSKNLLGYFGSWFLHLGILLIILFYIYGQVSFYSSEVYGVPGQFSTLEGTDYRVTIEDFQVSYGADGAVQQYSTTLSLADNDTQPLAGGSLNVNNPFRYKGYSFYQTGMGWAADCKIYKSGALLKNELLYEKTASQVPEESFAIALTKYYPDFAADETGFYSLSDRPSNPALLYALYYREEVVKMDIIRPGEVSKWNEYTFSLDNFRRYTYLKVNKMKGQTGAALGGMLILLGLVLNFYFKPRELAVMQDGELLNVYGRPEQLFSCNAIEKSEKRSKFMNEQEAGINVR